MTLVTSAEITIDTFVCSALCLLSLISQISSISGTDDVSGIIRRQSMSLGITGQIGWQGHLVTPRDTWWHLVTPSVTKWHLVTPNDTNDISNNSNVCCHYEYHWLYLFQYSCHHAYDQWHHDLAAMTVVSFGVTRRHQVSLGGLAGSHIMTPSYT